MIDVKDSVPPTVIAIARWVRTKASLSGWRRPEKHAALMTALARMRAQTLPAENGSPALVFSLRGWYPHAAWEAVLAHSLRLRGIPVHLFNCGGEMPVCEVNFRGANPAVACRECSSYPALLGSELELSRSWLRDYVSGSEQDKIAAAVDVLKPAEMPAWEWNGQPIGLLVRNSVFWFLRKSNIEDDSDYAVYRRFLISGANIATMAPRLLKSVQPRLVLQLNGRFFAEQIFNRFVPTAVPVVTYECGWRKDTLGFDRLSSADPIDLDDAWRRWKDVPLAGSESDALDEWIRARAAGDMQRDFYIDFNTNEAVDPVVRLGLNPDLPTAVLFTNLVWDTAVLGRDEAFPSIRSWLCAAIQEFTRRPEWQLIVRIHPAEDLRPSQPSTERLTDVIGELGVLSPNVKVVLPTERLSSYALMDRCRATLVYTSTAGLEAAVRGKPVVVGARVYYRGRGFTIDAASPGTFDTVLRSAMSQAPDAGKQELARRFAFLLLFRYLKHVPVVKQQASDFPTFEAAEVDQLRPGAVAEFDALMDAIIAGGPFV